MSGLPWLHQHQKPLVSLEHMEHLKENKKDHDYKAQLAKLHVACGTTTIVAVHFNAVKYQGEEICNHPYPLPS